MSGSVLVSHIGATHNTPLTHPPYVVLVTIKVISALWALLPFIVTWHVTGIVASVVVLTSSHHTLLHVCVMCVTHPSPLRREVA